MISMKYRSLYSSVPNSEEDLTSLHDVMKSNINYCEKVIITPEIIKTCIRTL